MSCCSMLYLEEERPRTLSPARLEEDTREGAVLSPSQVTFRVPFPHPGLDPGPGDANGGWFDGIIGCFKPMWAIVGKNKPSIGPQKGSFI